MLVNVSNHTDAELDHRIRHGKRLIEAAKIRAAEAYDSGNMNAVHMHQGYGLYIQRCIDQAQQELDRHKS